MIFSKPISFTDALESRAVKAILPTEASALELQAIAPEVRERSLFSARTKSARHLGVIDGVIERIVDPDFVVDPDTGQKRPRRPGEYMSEARARMMIRACLKQIGYDPADIGAKPGSLKDLGSERRIRMILEVNTGMARGYAHHKQGQHSAILDQWPAQELVREQSRRTVRNWHQRWRDRGGKVFSGVGLDGKPGRLIALKNDPIWTRLGPFQLPYPPFDYESGVGVDDVDRDEAMKLGIIDRDTQISPDDRGFNDDLQASAPRDIAKRPELLEAILQALGETFAFQDGAFVKAT